MSLDTTQNKTTTSATAPSIPAADLVTIKIDGREVQVKKGTNLLEACLQSQVDVSYFCYHPVLSSPAVCRQRLYSPKRRA